MLHCSLASSASIARRLAQQKRFAGGFLKKNLYVEENAGIRENSYKTWNFNGDNVKDIFLMLILPGTLFYYAAVSEMKDKDAQIGKKQDYGLTPKM